MNNGNNIYLIVILFFYSFLTAQTATEKITTNADIKMAIVISKIILLENIVIKFIN